jgi:hypothetical protein
MDKINDNIVDYEKIKRKETLTSFMQNPQGTGIAAANKKFVVQGLENSYEKLLKETGAWKYRVFRIGKDLYFQVMVPSETFKDFTYDVVIQFIDGDGATNLAGKQIKLFSNCPSFVFTYAYAYAIQGLLCDSLFNKFPQEVFKEAPKIRNPAMDTGYEKTLFYALYYITKNNLILRGNFNGQLVSTNMLRFLPIIKSSMTKLSEYNAHKKGETVKKKEKEKILKENNTEEKFANIHKRTSDKKVNLDTGTSTYKKSIYNKVDNKVDSKTDNKVKKKVKK